MLGLGKWECKIDSMVFKGKALLTVSDNNGSYDIDLKVQGFEIPDYRVEEITHDGCTITAKVTTSILKGKEIPVSITFDGDTFTGFLKIPMLGKVKLKEGKQISD